MNTVNTLKQTLEKNRDNYLDALRKIIQIDTENIGHGILGGKEYEGQIFLENYLKI